MKAATRPTSTATKPARAPLLLLLLLALLAPAARAFDARDIPSPFWACSAPGGGEASVFLVFSNVATAVACGSEVLYADAQLAPAMSYADADPALRYTLLVLDRDAPNASVPLRSPLIHMALADVRGADLAPPSSVTPVTAELTVLFNYSGPQPPANSGCHRYYIFLFEQTPGVSPTLNVTQRGRYTFDFPSWATSNSLTFLNVTNFFSTQNAATRTGGCGAAPAQNGAPAAAAAALPAAALLAAAVLSLALAQ